MLSDWTAECGPDDPVLVVPWSDPADPSRHFIDLRKNPDDLDWIEEAAQHPPMLHALRALNAPRSPVFSAKCDVFPLPKDDLAHLRLELDLIPEDSTVGVASYIDLLWRERSTFVSRHQHEQLLDRLTRLASPLPHSHATLECVLRPALIDLSGPQEGFAVTLYIKAAGHDTATAHEYWGAALHDTAALLRSRAFAVA